MKKKSLQFIGLSFVMALLLFGCSKDDSTKPDQGIVYEGNFFLDAAKGTTPVIEASSQNNAVALKSTEETGDWTNGNPLYEMFSILRDYNNETDEGTVGTENIYKTLFQTGQFFDATQESGDTIPDQVITSPFDFGNGDVNYNIAVNDDTDQNGFAIKKDGDINYALFGWHKEYTNESEWGVLQGNYDKSTGDLSVDLVSFSNAQNPYAMRIEIEGNDSTHQFTIRLMKHTEGGYTISVVGHGISKGEGNYFLFKVRDWENNTPNITDKYYCFNATATEDTLKTMNYLGSETVISECADYQSTVDRLNFFTLDDLPQSAADFNKGGTGTAAEGTIYLEFEN